MFCGHFLETAVHLAYRMSSVLEPKVWLKFLFFFFNLGFLDGTVVLIVPVLYHCLAFCLIHSNLKAK